MAKKMSGRGAYWLGALLGLGFSGALAVGLSLATAPGSDGNQQVAATSPAQTSAPDPAPAQQPDPTPAEAAPPEPVATPAPAPAPQVAVAPPPAPEPAPEPVPEATEQETAALAPDPAPPAPRETNGLPPYQAFAEIYRGDASLPLLAIVLTGIGAEEGEESASMIDELLLLPGPLSIVIAPNVKDPEAVALDIRDSGFEALMGVNGSIFSGETDAIAAVVEAMRGAGEVIGVATLGEQMEDSAAALAVVEAAAAEGMAILDATRDGGSVAYRLADARNLPAASTGRRFDEDQSSALVFQSLERAAFDARRTGAFVVVAEATPAVLTGLRRWMSVKANKSVAVAPLSAVIDKIVRQ